MNGVRSVLSIPRAYQLWSRLVGGADASIRLVEEHVRPWPGARVLDLGCGPGQLVGYLGDVHYVGVDTSEEYISRARRMSRGQAEFRVGDATALDPDLRDFDLVLAFGLIHHLGDDEAGRFFREAATALAPGGRFVSVDPTLVPNERRTARILVSCDRGQHVRTPDEYVRLAERSLSGVQSTVRRDLLRMPYTHCVLEA